MCIDTCMDTAHTRAMTQTKIYSVTVTDNCLGTGWSIEHLDIFTAKEQAAVLLRERYSQAPDEVPAVTERFIDEINTHRGAVSLYNDYLDATVEITAETW